MKLLLFWLCCFSLVWAQDEPTFKLNVWLVARQGQWSAGLPGEPELRIKGKSRSWSYFDQFRKCLFLVIDDGGWPAADNEDGWRNSAGKVVGVLAEGKPVTLSMQELHKQPGCILQAGEVAAQALRLQDGRHLLLAVVPFSTQKPPTQEFFAGLEVPAQYKGYQVNSSSGNNASDWSLVFPAAPQGTTENLWLQQGSATYRVRQLSWSGSRSEQLSRLQAEVSQQGQLVGQRSYNVEGLAMQQYMLRDQQGLLLHERILWLRPDLLLWLSVSGVDSQTAQEFFTSFRRWN